MIAAFLGRRFVLWTLFTKILYSSTLQPPLSRGLTALLVVKPLTLSANSSNVQAIARSGVNDNTLRYSRHRGKISATLRQLQIFPVFHKNSIVDKVIFKFA